MTIISIFFPLNENSNNLKIIEEIKSFLLSSFAEEIKNF